MTLGTMISVWAVAAAAGLFLARVSRGITFVSCNSDNEKQVRAAAQSHEWHWPSDMHRYAKEKARMKDIGVLGLAFMQRLLGDFKSEYPLTLWCIATHSISAVLVFFVAAHEWSMSVGWLLCTLYLTSFWPYQIVLGGGYQVVAQMFVLASIFCIQHMGRSPWSDALWGMTAGIAVIFMLFSSASGRKFLPICAGAFLLSQSDYLIFNRIENSNLWVWYATAGFMAAGLFCALGMFFIFYRPLMTAIYEERVPWWLQSLMGSRRSYPLSYYLKARPRIMRFLMKVSGVGILFVSSSLLFSRSPSFYWAEFWISMGGVIALLFLTLPDVVGNVKGYFSYWNVVSTSGHFLIYRDHFAVRGKSLPKGMRGAGFPWLRRYFWRVVPFYCILSGVLFSFLIGLAFFNRDLQLLWKTMGLAALGFSPILFGEMTGSPQLGRAYFPAFLGLLLLIGGAVFEIMQRVPQEGQILLWCAMGAVVVLNAGWNLWIFLDDVWPTRMAATWLAEVLQRLKVKMFYTYDTPYNDAFVKVISERMGAQWRIQYISSLNEVKEGYLVVPETSAKSINMESQSYAIEHGDFDKDPLLNKWIESREIRHYAVASFKTMGASRIWVHESEVASYRDLILREVTERDRWRGMGWILDASRFPSGRGHQEPMVFDTHAVSTGIGHE